MRHYVMARFLTNGIASPKCHCGKKIKNKDKNVTILANILQNAALNFPSSITAVCVI